MTNIYFLNKQITAKLVAAVTLVSLLVSAFPVAFFVANAANTDAVGTVTVAVMPNPTAGASEYVQISFYGTGTLNLNGWSFSDGTSVRYTFGATDTLTDSQTILLCGNDALSTVCDGEYSGGAEVWANNGDTFTLFDDNSEVKYTDTWSSTVVGGLRVDSFEVSYLTANQDGNKKVNICHKTGDTFEFISVDVSSIGDGHGNGDGDIIPVLDSVTNPYPGQNLNTVYGEDTGAELLANECVPTPVDVCPQDGIQTSLESCPVPSVDVCPNIPQAQATLVGYVKDAAGNCIKEVTSVCKNGSNLLTNASFEEPVADANAHAGGLWEIFSSVLGWNISSDGLEIWNGLFGGASTGIQNAELDGNQNTTISQTITTIPGAMYELKFDFSARPSVVDNAITAKVNGVDVASATADGTGLTTTSWQTVTQTFVATTTATQVQFVDNGVSNSLGSLIDNTAVCFVSEPVEPEPVATIVATKIVCADEADLPNWNTDGRAPTIDENTASEFIATKSEGECWLEEGWEFEWAHQGAADPGDTATGTAGVQWTTFEPTDGLGTTEVTLDGDALDGSSYLWVREVLKDGYIPFTHSATPNNSNNVTAEMYCHTDGLNYDNLDRIDGVSVDNTYHCVAFNAETPKPIEQCTLEMNSDEGTVVVERNGYASSTYVHGSWANNIPGASWIWNSLYVENPNETSTTTFKETFQVNNPTEAKLVINADNWYKIKVNGVEVVNRNGVNSYQVSQQKTFTSEILDELVSGLNTVEFTVINDKPGSSATKLTNPAGLLYKLAVKGDKDESCKVTTAPTPVTPEKIFETVVIKQSDLKGWVIEESGGGNTEFVLNGTAPLGTGTLNLVSDAQVTARAGASKTVDVKLVDLEGLSYKTRQNDAIPEGDAAYRIRFDADGDISTTNDVATLIYEPYWQNAMSPDPAPVVPDVWQTWNVDDGHFWVSVPGGSAAFFSTNGVINGAGGPPFFTLPQMQAFYPNAKVTSFGVHIGSYNPLYNIDVDAVVFGTDVKQSTYDFEPETIVPCEYNSEISSENELCVPPPTECPEGFQKVGESNECTAIPPTITPDNNDNGGGTRTGSRSSGRSGQVLGASTMQCGMYLFDYMKEGSVNDEFEVKKLQWFLIGQGYVVPVTGIFDDATDAAVKAFQLKYKLDVLTPWFKAGFVPHENPTGWVYQLTRWKINNIVCPGSEAAPVLVP